MSSDKLDNKIIEAAKHHHPAYDETAWRNMERLLDKHLPQKKEKKRRIIFFILIFLLIGMAGLWYFSGSFKANNKKLSETINNSQITDPKKKNINSDERFNNKEVQQTPLIIEKAPKENKIIFTDLQNNGKKQYLLSENRNQYSNKITKNDIYPDLTKQVGNESQTKENKTDASNKDSFFSDSLMGSNVQNIDNITGNVVMKINDKIKDTISEDILLKNDDTQIEQELNTVIKKKTSNKRSNYFFINLSASPDISFVGTDRAGAIKIMTGAGIGYTFKNRLSIRTGFYTGRKVYSSSSDNYNPPQIFSQYYPILENVDADCKVFEIPVSISYSFGHSEKQNWFAGVGISSLLMKKETYSYTYKYTSTGPSYKSDYTLKNKNNHYFSVFTLSGGYQHQISKAIYFSAEPYFKIPLKGVGFGKVKLNSAGMMFNILIKPFSPKPK